VRKQYAKIDTEDVTRVMDQCCWQGVVISTGNIAVLLQTSKYQVRKILHRLQEDGLVKYKMVLWGEEEPPMWGYALTDKFYELQPWKAGRCLVHQGIIERRIGVIGFCNVQRLIALFALMEALRWVRSSLSSPQQY